MQSTREIYWNVGHWVTIPMYALAVLIFGIVVYGFFRRYRIWRSGKTLGRLDHISARVGYFIRRAIDQKKVLRVRSAGLPHAVFFWAFVILFVATILIMVQVDLLAPVLDVTFLKGWFYRFFSLSTDLAGIAALLGLAALSVRRFVIRPKGLVTVADDYLMHGLLFTILITGFLIEGARIASTELRTNPALASWSPGGLLVAQALKDVSVSSLRTLHRVLWWVHFGLVYAFLGVIPFTKFRHIFTTPFNYLFRPHGAKGAIASIDLDDETIEQYGAAKVTDLTWKDIFDADACTSCKRCQDRCPAWNTGKPLSPMSLVQEIGRAAFKDSTCGLVEAISPDAIWACTTCRACEEICPAEIEHVNKILELRRNLVLMDGAFPGDEVRAAIDAIEVGGNPFAMSRDDRGGWVRGLNVVVGPRDGDVDVLYFPGCYASYDLRNQKVARSFVATCGAAAVRVGILGKSERCCGEPARKLGQEYLYQILAAANVQAIAATGVRLVVTTCPHCFDTLNHGYRELGLDVEVLHATTFVCGLVDAGRLQLDPEPFTCTVHDSCYLGRYNDIYSEPRTLLQAAGAHVAEMRQHGAESFCCGGGGGRVLADERIGTRVSVSRVQQAEATGSPVLASSCPFCLTMFEDGIGAAGLEDALRARDVIELVGDRLRSNPIADCDTDGLRGTQRVGVVP